MVGRSFGWSFGGRWSAAAEEELAGVGGGVNALEVVRVAKKARALALVICERAHMRQGMSDVVSQHTSARAAQKGCVHKDGGQRIPLKRAQIG